MNGGTDMTVTAGHRVLLSILWLLVVESSSTAAVFWDDDFEESAPENSGWGYTQSACWPAGQPTRTTPCPYLDTTTEQAHSGTHSLKADYSGQLIGFCGGGFCYNGETNQAIFRQVPHTDELYTRYYYRAHAFSYETASGTKHFYQDDTHGNFYPQILSANMFGNQAMAMIGGIIAEACGQGDGSGPVTSGYDDCNYYPNVNGGISFADDQWYCVETHTKMNTPGVADGVLEIWVDGNLSLQYLNRMFRGPDPNGINGNSSLSGFDDIKIYKQSGSGVMYYDQFAVGTTQIGCGGGGAPVPPLPPTNLRFSALWDRLLVVLASLRR